MTKSHQIVVAPTTTQLRPGWTPLVLGCGAGTRGNKSGMKRAVEDGQGDYGTVIYADAVASHADRAAREATEAGIPARGIALSTHDLAKSGIKPDVIVSQLDRADAQLAALDYATERGIPFLSYFLLAPPRNLPIAFMAAFTPDDLTGPPADDLRLALRTIAPITARRGAAGLTDGEVEAELRVAGIRDQFRQHLSSTLRKLSAGLTPDVAPIVATDGERVAPVVVLGSDRWATPIELEERVLLQRRDILIEPGSRILVVEALSGEQPELRLHDVVFRKTDRRLGSRGSQTVTAADFAPLAPVPPSPRSTTQTSSALATRGERDGSIVDALVGLAAIAILLSAASRLAPVRSSD